MIYYGTIRNGVVVFDTDARPPDGTRVWVTVLGSINAGPETAPDHGRDAPKPKGGDRT